MKVSELSINNYPDYNNSYVIIDNYSNNVHRTEKCAIEKFALHEQLSSYVTYSDLSNYVTFDDLSNNGENPDLSSYITIDALDDGQIPMITGSGEYSGVTSDYIVRRAYASANTYSQINNNPLSDYDLLISLPDQNDDYPQLLKVSIAELAQYIQNYSST